MVPTYFSREANDDPKSQEQQWFYSPYASTDEEQIGNMCSEEELTEMNDGEEEEQAGSLEQVFLEDSAYSQ